MRDPQDRPPEAPLEPGAIDMLRRLAANRGVSFEAVEEAWGLPVAEWRGESSEGVEARAIEMIEGLAGGGR